MGCTSCGQGNNQGSSNSSGCCDLKAMDVVTPLNDIRNGDENFCFSEITDKICENLQNDEGINPSVSHSNTDCDDLSSLNDLATGSLHNSLMTLNICDVDAYKCWLDSLLSWFWNLFKAIICAICGLWCHVRDLYKNDNIQQQEIECLSEALIALYKQVAGPTQLNFSSSGSGITWTGHSGTPSWSSGDNYKNPSTWTAVSDISHSNYWIDSNPESLKGKFFMQYGGNGNGWASARFVDYALTITKQDTNTDGSIDISYTLDLGNFKGHATETGGITVNYDIKVQDQTEWSFKGDTGDDFSIAPNHTQLTGKAYIKPGETYTGALLNFNVSYPNGEFSPNTFTIGFLIKNPIGALPNCIQDIDQFEDGSCTKKS
ncbi:hypothetical protein ABLU29_09550 [Lactococcus lactis]|uniref:hypothetical protein n=1 Tax=Lactococcus lactis TaxID=1358 RepID=UPI003877D5E5